MWNQPDQVEMLDTKVPVLSPEDLLLVLCVHGTKHMWERLEWICGISALVRGARRLDFGLAMAQARRLGSA